jgi:hypothetical protein
VIKAGAMLPFFYIKSRKQGCYYAKNKITYTGCYIVISKKKVEKLNDNYNSTEEVNYEEAV